MTTAVYSAIPTLHSKPTFICALGGLSPNEAIETLKRVGIIAFPSESDECAIVLVGFSYEISTLVRELTRQERAARRDSRTALRFAGRAQKALAR